MAIQSMAIQETLEKPLPAANGHRTEAGEAIIENHPLAGVIGSFADDLATLDAIMAGVGEYRREREAEEAGAEIVCRA